MGREVAFILMLRTNKRLWVMERKREDRMHLGRHIYTLQRGLPGGWDDWTGQTPPTRLGRGWERSTPKSQEVVDLCVCVRTGVCGRSRPATPDSQRPEAHGEAAGSGPSGFLHAASISCACDTGATSDRRVRVYRSRCAHTRHGVLLSADSLAEWPGPKGVSSG